MARAQGVIKTSVWEPDSEFRTLTPQAQWVYLMLVSQPQINNLGLLAYTPLKWARLAEGLTVDTVEAAVGELEKRWFVLVDRAASELLVRTFIKHDGTWKHPYLIKSARKLIREVESGEIRDNLIGRHPWLTDESDAAAIALQETPSKSPSGTPSESPFPKSENVGKNPVENAEINPIGNPIPIPNREEGGSRGSTAVAVVPEASASSPPSQPSPPDANEQGGHDPYGSTNHPRELALLHTATGGTPEALAKLKRGSKGATVADLVAAREAATGPGVRDRLAVALAELKNRRDGLDRRSGLGSVGASS